MGLMPDGTPLSDDQREGAVSAIRVCMAYLGQPPDLSEFPRETVDAYSYIGVAVVALLRQLGMIIHGLRLTPEQLEAAYASEADLGSEPDDYAREQLDEFLAQVMMDGIGS